MIRRIKLHTGLSVLALSGALAAAGCGGEGGSKGGEGDEGGAVVAHQGAAAPTGEGEQAAAATAAEDFPAYMSALLSIKGHLKTGGALYSLGDAAGAATHMKHPKDELYAKLEPAFRAHRAKGFAKELEQLSAAVEGGEATGVMFERQAAVFAAIDAAIAAAAPSTRDQLLGIASLVETAGKEFDLGVQHGAVVRLHEYQDAHGFLTVAVETLGRMKAKDGAEEAAVADAREQAARALAVAPSVVPGDVSAKESSPIFGAAARIELKARGLSE
ncbi:MAG: hypothetical protein K2Q06_01460 [Parvularculaceae bacterium]|nr:hypothetical protein [Parvularculaceae bacterium]